MLVKRTYALIVIVFVLIFTCGLFSTDAAAQADGKARSDLMAKKGMAGLFAGKLGQDDERAPSQAQKWLGFGSLGVMVLVIKYL